MHLSDVRNVDRDLGKRELEEIPHPDPRARGGWHGPGRTHENKGLNTMYTTRREPPTARGRRQVAHLLWQVLSITILLSAAPVAAQWSTQSPLPTYLDARGVGAPTAQRVFIATDDNSFDNGGALFESGDLSGWSGVSP